jgi:hypothetical protein
MGRQKIAEKNVSRVRLFLFISLLDHYQLVTEKN